MAKTFNANITKLNKILLPFVVVNIAATQQIAIKDKNTSTNIVICLLF